VARPCTAIRVLNLTGPVFFGVAGELDAALDKFIRDPDLRVLILRMRQTESLDVTTASVLEAAAQKLASRGRMLFLLGLKGPAIEFLERTGFAERIGKENIFPIEPGWFSAMESALQRALERVGDHACGRACPFSEYLALERKAARRRTLPQDWSI